MKIIIEDVPAGNASNQLDLSKQKIGKKGKKSSLGIIRSCIKVQNILMHYIIMRCFILWHVGTLLLWLKGV